MPAKKYIICLSPEERKELEQVSRWHRRSGREKMRARILLLCDTSLGREEGARRIDEEIVAQLGCGMPTVFKPSSRCASGPLSVAPWPAWFARSSKTARRVLWMEPKKRIWWP